MLEKHSPKCSADIHPPATLLGPAVQLLAYLSQPIICDSEHGMFAGASEAV